jgi:ABC-type branched-subunit amino acid transport system substrate-binding protein
VKSRARGVGIVLTALSLALVTGCGRDSDGGDTANVPGVTSEPCPDAVDQEKGCIYLGVITDLTGVFKGVGVPVTEGQKAFWAKVNADGGIGDYEVDVVTHVKDNAYNPDTHAAVFAEIEDDVLALAQSLGTAHTNGILEDVQENSILTQPTSLGSNWIFEEGVTEIGTNYCAEAMNIVDYAVDELGAKSIAAVHYAGDYGDDNMVGARIAAEERGIKFTDIPLEVQVEESQAAAVGQIKRAKPDVVVIATGPTDLAAVVGLSAAGGYTGKFIGAIPSWNSALVASPAGPAITALYLQATSFGTWEADTAGHEAMRAAAGSAAPNDWYMIGWAGQYVMKAALEAAIEDDNLTREGLVEAGMALDGVDGEGMLPEGSGNYAGGPNEAVSRATYFSSISPDASTGLSLVEEAFTGPTAEGYDFVGACYEEVDLG